MVKYNVINQFIYLLKAKTPYNAISSCLPNIFFNLVVGVVNNIGITTS